jgi:hypothetical protein
MSDEDRPQKKWFYTDQGEVYEGIGLQCAPQNPEYWYVPHFGSVHQDNLYESRGDARRAAIKWCEMMVKHHQAKLEKLLKE